MKTRGERDIDANFNDAIKIESKEREREKKQKHVNVNNAEKEIDKNPIMTRKLKTKQKS